MNADIQIERSILLPAPYEKVRALLADLEGTIRRFPKLRKLTRLAPDTFLWEMDTIGSRIANIAHRVSYAARYRVDLDRGEIAWQPVPGKGNASIAGAFRLKELGSGTRLSFRVEGELRDIPVPLLYRMLAPPFIQGKFTRLVEIFLERLAESLGLDERQVEQARASVA